MTVVLELASSVTWLVLMTKFVGSELYCSLTHVIAECLI